jgi:hypothetical protein
MSGAIERISRHVVLCRISEHVVWEEIADNCIPSERTY